MPIASTTQSPIDDLTFDVITVLQNKAKALEAYDKYISDAGDDVDVREIFQEMRRQDEEHVRVLKEVLARRLDEELGYDEDYEDEEEDEDFEDEEEDEAEDTVDVAEPDAKATNDSGPPPRRGQSSQRHRA